MTRPRIENVIVDWSKTGDLRSTSKWFRRPALPKLPPAVLLEAATRGKAEIACRICLGLAMAVPDVSRITRRFLTPPRPDLLRTVRQGAVRTGMSKWMLGILMAYVTSRWSASCAPSNQTLRSSRWDLRDGHPREQSAPRQDDSTGNSTIVSRQRPIVTPKPRMLCTTRRRGCSQSAAAGKRLCRASSSTSTG